MMRFALDIVIVAIVLLCAWRGYRAGIINGICGIIAIIIAIYGANLVAHTYSDELISAMDPFVSGIVEGIEAELPEFDLEDLESLAGQLGVELEGELEIDANIAGQLGIDLSELEGKNLGDVLDDGVYVAAYTVINKLGVHPLSAAPMAQEVVDLTAAGEMNIIDALTDVICRRAALIAVFVVAFILISIVFSAIGNIIDLSFGLPGLEIVNHIIGALLAAARCVMVLFVLALVARYLGLVMKGEMFEGSYFLNMLMEQNLLSDILKI